MAKLFIPALSILTALGLYFFFTQDTLDNINKFEAEIVEFDAALANAEELDLIIFRLLEEKGNISKEDIDKLDILLPTSIDAVRFVYDLDTIVRIHGKTLNDVDIDEGRSGGKDEEESLFTSTVVTFSLNGTYDELIAIISDFERSLALVDVLSIRFAITNDADTDGIDYAIVLATHALK